MHDGTNRKSIRPLQKSTCEIAILREVHADPALAVRAYMHIRLFTFNRGRRKITFDICGS